MKNDENNNNTITTIIIIVIVIIVLLAIYFMFFRNRDDIDNINNDLNNDNLENNIYNAEDNMIDDMDDMKQNTEDDFEIIDENARNFYEGLKRGIILNGKLIEVPAEYITKVGNKIKVEGYKLSDDAKKGIDDKMSQIQDIFNKEGKSDINELSETSRENVNKLMQDINNML